MKSLGDDSLPIDVTKDERLTDTLFNKDSLGKCVTGATSPLNASNTPKSTLGFSRFFFCPNLAEVED